MLVVVVYDVNQRRVSKVNKICKKYLYPVQRSVFEGNITRDKLKKLQNELECCINVEEDSICIYELDSVRDVSRTKIGLDERREYII